MYCRCTFVPAAYGTEVERETPSDLFWPLPLLSPAPIKVVYFDMFVWRGLANAVFGHPNGDPFIDLLDECRKAVKRRAAFFPVSRETVVESNKYGGLEGRAQFAKTVLEIGHLQSFASRRAIRRLELDAAFSALIGPSRVELGPYFLVGRTILHAFDQEIVMPRWDTATGASINEKSEAWTESTRDEAERLGGFEYLQVALLCTGNDSGELTKPSEKALARETYVLQQFSAHQFNHRHNRRRYLGNLLAARELAYETDHSDLDEALENRGTSFAEWIKRDDHELGLKLINGMPSHAVSIALRMSYYRKRDMKLTQNHVHDMAFLSMAVPYCDAVYTDKAVRKELAAANLGRRMHTKLLENPTDAADYIASLPGLNGSGTFRFSGPGETVVPEDPSQDQIGLAYYFDAWEDDESNESGNI
jgi:hypothetical protein